MNRRSILIVEDDQELREALVDTVQGADYTVLQANSGEAALRELAIHSVDLVCSDVNMPGINGMQLMERIQQEYPGLPVILMTAYGSVEHSVRAMHQGAADYLVKPFRSDLLLELIDKHSFAAAKTVPAGPVAVEQSSLELLQIARRVAASEVTVLITGESGSGKEVLARYIHQQSTRHNKPFVAINCAAIPENMLEATLFGYEKGAFTGAHMSREGKFELADGGTILLDEISEMDAGLQAKLLRVLQEREVERLGSKQTLTLDVRVIATSNRDLRQCVQDGTFREDLYYRLSVVPMQWLPLRERRADILPIAERLVAEHCRKMGRHTARLQAEAQRTLLDYNWPGNVRELDNTIQRALVMQDDGVIESRHLGLDTNFNGGFGVLAAHPCRADEGDAAAQQNEISDCMLDSDLKQREFEVILTTLRQHRGKRKQTAEVLGISARTLRYKLARMRDSGIDVDAMIEA